MLPLRALIPIVLVVAWLGSPPIASVDDASAASKILRVDEHRERAVPVKAWDPGSPQRLVRIDGNLYQKDAGRFFPAIPDRITVRLAEGVKDWDDLVDRAGALSPQTFGILSELEPVRVNRLGIVDLAVPKGADLTVWCELVHRTGLARYAEIATYGEFLAIPNDPRYPNQWALNNTGQGGGLPGSDVDAERAWDLTAGDPAIVVAVVDSGTDIDHEDLAANVWHNEGEIPDNGLDDDGNGFIDDWEGWDFHNDNNEPRPVYYHGTHVTGIVNAVGDNGIGIAGLAGGLGGPGVLGMAVSVGDEVEDGNVIDDGIVYAADNGAHVITLAFSTAETQAINDALDYAYETKDVFVDCASGNNDDEVGYPARHPAVMAIAATDFRDNKSSFSNAGPEVEVAAPGTNILSTGLNDSYGTSSGTSFAAPHVAGLAALVRGRNPELPAADVRLIITVTADDVGQPGFDTSTGHGRINAFEAVKLASTSDGIVRFLADEYTCDGAVDLFVTDADLAGTGTVSVTVSSDTEPAGESVILTETNGGSGLFRGSIQASGGAAWPDGMLQLMDGDTLVAEYLDLDDGLGGTGVAKLDTATADCRTPWITEVRVEGVSGTSASVRWATDEDSDSRVVFGETIPPSGEETDLRLVKAHAVNLTGLSECTIYHYSVNSSDAAGNVAVVDNGGDYFHFETLADFGQGLQPCHQGRVFIDVDAVGCSSSVPLTVGDQDLNTDPGVAETVTVALTSTTEPSPEYVLLTETGPDTSTFTGSIPTAPGTAVQGDGILQVTHDDLLTARYEDDDDGTGNPGTSYDTAAADCAGPDHIVVSVVDISDATATIEWTASEDVTGYVDWGTTPALGTQVSSDTLATTHGVTIGTFDECARIFFRVVSEDAQGNIGVADSDGTPFEFNTYTVPGAIFRDDFETANGWTLEPEWEIGAPQGLGSAPGDPLVAITGTGVLGQDLSGQGDHPGDYEPSTATSAVSPVIDASALVNAELMFHRLLVAAHASIAYVDVKTAGGAWQQVYGSPTSGGHTDWSWTEQSHDVSQHADGNPNLQIRFRLSSFIASSFAPGWNADRLILRDGSLPEIDACGGCGGAPTFAGVLSAVDDDSCVDSGVTLTWSEAPAWGTGTTGSYAIYRDTQAGFEPGPGNLLAAGIDGTSWTDPTPPSGVTLYYAVRAENDETCAAGPANGGVMDVNLVYATAINDTVQPPPGAVGNTLHVARVNRAHTRLTWTPAPGAAVYHVYRSPSPDDGFSAIASPADALFEDPGAMTDGQDWYYLVRSADACDNEE
jgi:hypothetical protein